MSGRTADFFSSRPAALPTHAKRASYSGTGPPAPPPARPIGHDRRASWHCTPTSFQPLALNPTSPAAEDQHKVSDLEARLSAAACDLGGGPVEGPSVWDPDSESSAKEDDDSDDDEDFSSNDEYGWSSPDDSPLPTPVHSPSLAARPLKPALRSRGSCSSASSSVLSFDGTSEPSSKRRCCSFVDQPEVCPTWSGADYERAGPPPVFKLSIREVLELRQMKLECSPHQPPAEVVAPLFNGQEASSAACQQSHFVRLNEAA